MASDRLYLEKHGNQWRVQVKVPKPARKVIGKAKLVRSLHTDSLIKAKQLRWPIVAEFKQTIANALNGVRGTADDPLIAHALEWQRDAQEAAKRPSDYAEYGPDGEMIADAAMVMSSLLSDRAEEIGRSEGPARATMFHSIASGSATPIQLLVTPWQAEWQVKPRQKLEGKRAIDMFAAYVSDRKESVTVQAVTKRLAGEFVSSRVAEGMHPSTLNKHISTLSVYWQWLVKKGHAKENVWQRQSLKKKKIRKNEAKRPYTNSELRKLLEAEAAPLLHDAMRIAALSGMRVEEIARLKVADCKDGFFEIHEAKTKAGERRVPIHSQLAKIVLKRCAGKKPTDYLFDELPTPSLDSPVERSQRISKNFTKYRRDLGVDEVVEGSRQSRIDFHSFRRWFIKTAGDALQNGAKGYDPWTVAAVVGHEGGSDRLHMTMVHYRGKSEEKALRACIEAVRLPL